MSLFLYVCEANLWTLDAPGYCEGDVVRDRWTPARCTQAPTAPLPVHLWSPGVRRWVSPVGCQVYPPWVRANGIERGFGRWLDVQLWGGKCRPT